MSASPSRRIRSFLTHIFPWALFLACLLWGWRVKDLFYDIPAYGDVLEHLWGITWYGDHLFSGGFPSFFPLVFLPQGWWADTAANSPAIMLALAPLYKLGGAAFAYNVACLLSFFVAFAGMLRLARQFSTATLFATVAALFFTFWGFRWFRASAHLHALLSTSLLPWLLYCVERGWRSERHAFSWFAAAGICWGLATAFSYYFIWFGGLIVIGWLGSRWLADRSRWRIAVQGVIVMVALAALLSGPFLLRYEHAVKLADARGQDIAGASTLGASLNSLPINSRSQSIAWLSNLSRWLYHGPRDESGYANLGLLASAVALVGLWRARKDRQWWPVMAITGLGLVFALGYVLRWDDAFVEWPGLRPLDRVIWSIGHRLKPDIFRPAEPTWPFVQGVPLPSFLLAAMVPFWDSARTLVRFVFVALPGFCLLVAGGLQAGRWRILRVALVALLLVEVFPRPTGSVPASPPAHPAFDWLRANTQAQDGLIDLRAASPFTLQLIFGGEVLWATQYHQRATANAVGSVWPEHAWFLYDWLVQHPHAAREPDFVPLLQAYHINYILLHMRGASEKQLLSELGAGQGLRLVQCFDPPQGQSPWPSPICILQVLSQPDVRLNMQLRDGWSAPESWGVWAEGRESRAEWLATTREAARLTIEAFPECVPGQPQGLSLTVNGTALAEHHWQACEPWSSEIEIPGELVRVGWNELVLRYDYSARPSEVTQGTNPDQRLLSVGFTRLAVLPS